MIYQDNVWTNRSIFAGCATFVALLVSVIFYTARPEPSVQRVLFFPDETTGVWRGEFRELPKQADREADVENLVLELILGPTSLRYGRTLPRGTAIRSLLLRKNVLYLDLSEHILDPVPAMLVGFDELLDGLEKTIRFNHPRIDEICIFVDGIETEYRTEERTSETREHRRLRRAYNPVNGGVPVAYSARIGQWRGLLEFPEKRRVSAQKKADRLQ